MGDAMVSRASLQSWTKNVLFVSVILSCQVFILKDTWDNIIEIFDLKWVNNESNAGTLCKRREAYITTTFWLIDCQRCILSVGGWFNASVPCIESENGLSLQVMFCVYDQQIIFTSYKRMHQFKMKKKS